MTLNVVSSLAIYEIPQTKIITESTPNNIVLIPRQCQIELPTVDIGEMMCILQPPSFFDKVHTGALAFANQVSTIANNAINNISKAITTDISDIAFDLGESIQNISQSAGYAIVNIGYKFISEPTFITDVTVEPISPTSVKITWKTNHPANGKVNYGTDRTYSMDRQSEERVTHHEFVLTDLTPDTLYHFEVMSHNNNYVYDADREFKTQPLP
ncbi:MAG: fibronectin type III domain-containing protein [Patescibacteria group bacterium]